ncbi:MAG: hypothetical protein L3K16_05000 [Thermoplasmata archaeon]|nr:hypothetical protein [Thermoplasmata archaeon]
MYDPSAPSTPTFSGSASSARYAYLVGRLRGRQITMEEATELFAIQQTMISRASVMNQVPPPPPPPDVDANAPPAVPSNPSTGGSLFSDENLAMTLLAMGVGAGLLAAVVKRAREGPKPTG